MPTIGPTRWQAAQLLKEVPATSTSSHDMMNDSTMRKKSNRKVLMKFLPMYHLVNNRYDRIPNAAMHNLKNALIGIIYNTFMYNDV